MGFKLVRFSTNAQVQLPYMVLLSFDGDGKELRKELVSRYFKGDFSCQIERYTSTAIINFRNEYDVADFLMRLE